MRNMWETSRGLGAVPFRTGWAPACLMSEGAPPGCDFAGSGGHAERGRGFSGLTVWLLVCGITSGLRNKHVWCMGLFSCPLFLILCCFFLILPFCVYVFVLLMSCFCMCYVSLVFVFSSFLPSTFVCICFFFSFFSFLLYQFTFFPWIFSFLLCFCLSVLLPLRSSIILLRSLISRSSSYCIIPVFFLFLPSLILRILSSKNFHPSYLSRLSSSSSSFSIIPPLPSLFLASSSSPVFVQRRQQLSPTQKKYDLHSDDISKTILTTG